MNTKGSENGMVDSVAISYAWIDDAYKEHVIGFVNYLRENGYDAVMDELLKQRETAIDFNEMMVKMIDWLIVYNNGFYAQIKELKKVVSLQLQRKYNIPIHFTTLTKEEFECLENMKAMQAHVVYSNVK